MGGRRSGSWEADEVAAVLTERWPKLVVEVRSNEYSDERVDGTKGEL